MDVKKFQHQEIQYEEMGLRIRKRRKELKIRQTDMAEQLGISNNHMSAIENGRQKPSLDVFAKICSYLCVTPNYLLLGSIHSYNLPQNMNDKLLLCEQADIKLANDFIELLINRNDNNISI